MATKIKRCLYVGLGGTGMNTLLHTKKTFIDTYGEVPPMIGFLGVDTDNGVYKKTLTSTNGDEIKLAPNEQMAILCTEPKPIYNVNKDKFSWLPESNLFALTGMTLGAGMVRTNGRFAFTVNYNDIRAKVQNILQQISNAHIVDIEKYELLSSATEIHMVFSVCGGTGAGTFINMAYLLRDVAPNCKLTGYAVLPDIFTAMSKTGMSKIAPNAYSSIMDLDYLMHTGMVGNNISLQYINNDQPIKDRPFNAVIFIDNKNDNLDTYTHIDELAEMISMALVTSSGELSVATASIADNLEKDIIGGAMDIENKRAWAAGMGICELKFRNRDLAKIYATKAAISLVDRMTNSHQDANTIANAWIDSPEVNIRENNGNDNLIDYIASPLPEFQFNEINDRDNAINEADNFLSSNQIKGDTITEKIKEKTDAATTTLRNRLIEYINQDGGVAVCKGILDGIKSQVNIFIGEMEEEKKTLSHEEPVKRSALETATKDLKEYNKKWVKKQSKMEELEQDVTDAANSLCICRREIQRRNAALQFYNGLKVVLQRGTKRVDDVEKNLKSVKELLNARLSQLQNNAGKSSPTFQIDLTGSLATNISVNSDEVQVNDFVRILEGVKKVYDFDDYRASEIEKIMLQFTQTLPGAKQLANTTIDNIINNMSDAELDGIIRRAISKSMPIFRYDYHGYSPLEQPHDSYYIGLPDRNNSRLTKNNYFKNLIPDGGTQCDFASIGQNDKIIIYRQVGVVPAYAIANIGHWQNQYDQSNISHHIDQNLCTRMEREEFSLQPKRTTDNDLLDLWVKGFIFGLVRNENGEYQFQDKENGEPLNNYWVPLGQYRDEAFSKFKTFKNTVRKQFNETIDRIVNSRGNNAIRTLLDEAKENYFENVSQIKMTREEVMRHGYESIKELISAEMKHTQTL